MHISQTMPLTLLRQQQKLILKQLYRKFLYFHRFTVRETTFKLFCEEASVEYRKL